MPPIDATICWCDGDRCDIHGGIEIHAIHEKPPAPFRLGRRGPGVGGDGDASQPAAVEPRKPKVPMLQVEQYALPNGLKVVLHEDHKTPVVAVNVWYRVGSKDERPGRTGFAHPLRTHDVSRLETSRQRLFHPARKAGRRFEWNDG